jgi:plastocyanin
MSSWFQRSSAAVAALVLFLGGAGRSLADTIMVDADSNFFSPFQVTVAVGDTVFWTSHSLHTVTSGANGTSDGLFDSGLLNDGNTFSFTFTQAGDYPYYCSLHFSCCDMEAIVHVVAPVKLRTHLGAADPDDPNATGKAEFQMRPDRAGFRLKAKKITSTGFLDVFINGNLVGSIVLDARGDGHLVLETQHGDSVPPLQDGDMIAVYDAMDDTTLILAGMLMSK